MTWMTILWPMAIGACVTMGLIQLRVGLRRVPGTANLLFALNAFVVAVYAGLELSFTHANSPDRYLEVLRWIDIVGGGPLIVSLIAFVYVLFGTGRKWLAFLATGVMCASLIPDLLPEPKLVFLHITRVTTMQAMGGGSYPVAEGVRNLWNAVFYLGVLTLLVFVADASVTLWHQGGRRRAVMLGGSITFFILFAGVHSALVDAGVVKTPYLFSFAYLAILAAMGWELSDDILNAAQVANNLRESQQRMAMATDSANLGIWVRYLVRDEIWATDKWRELLGFAKSERIDLNHYLEKLHPDDREAVNRALTNAINRDGHYETEYRVVLPDGQMRWIASRGKVDFKGAKKPVLVRSTSLDITTRKLAEESARRLGGRLIHAEEQERMRLARELHDSLSQSLALLSVELEMFGQNPPSELPEIATGMESFSSRVKELSSEVHRLSHDLHPAKLEQLGLVAAVRGFCKEFSLAHEMAIDFREHKVPREVPDDMALCIYRIAQEALHNVVKHSGGTEAKVELALDGKELLIRITDDGAGFNPGTSPPNGSLGLVSMRERACFVGGNLSIESHPGDGTRVEFRVPIPGANQVPPLVSANEENLPR